MAMVPVDETTTRDRGNGPNYRTLLQEHGGVVIGATGTAGMHRNYKAVRLSETTDATTTTNKDASL
jgi:hypothetical protein